MPSLPTNFAVRTAIPDGIHVMVFDDTVANIYLGPTLTARLRSRFAAGNGGQPHADGGDSVS